MASPIPLDFAELLARIAAGLRDHHLSFMVIGGHAVLLHGRPRFTEDVDITLAAAPTRLADIESVCDAVNLTPLPTDPERFVRETFVLPARASSGIRVDFIFSTTPYERVAIERAVGVDIDGTSVPFATAEDLLLHKIFAGRARDIEDAEGVVRRQGDRLDWPYVERWAGEFEKVEGREAVATHLANLRRLGQSLD